MPSSGFTNFYRISIQFSRISIWFDKNFWTPAFTFLCYWRLFGDDPSVWPETVGLRTRPVSDQKIGLGLAGLMLCCETRFCMLVVIMILKDTTILLKYYL